MCSTQTFLKKSLINALTIFSILCLSPLFISNAFAKAGCCSHHGGVASCDYASGRVLCKDGVVSPSCPCAGTKLPKSTTTKPTKVNYPTWGTPTPTRTTTTTPAPSTVSTKGCCARHGGVAGCDKKSGYYRCKDGTKSATCRCK